MIKRIIQGELKKLALQYPVVIITGPRQSGKTTLAQNTFPKKKYLSLEEPDIKEISKLDPIGFLKKFPSGAIIDEIQRVPELLSYIQGIVDKEKKKGMFILTGSNQFSLMNSVTQSLAGRAALLKLLPLTISETKLFGQNQTLDQFLHKGFFPGIYDNNLEPYRAYRNYYETYVERDLKQLISIKDILKFQLFMRLCAGRVGQLLNTSNLSNEVGVSVPTIQNWLSVLQASYIVFLLPPWHANIKKRLIKSPKLYFYDVGLANFLLGNENIKHISRDPLRGALFENLIVSELLKNRFNKGLDSNLYFYRDNHQNEIDVITKTGDAVHVIEIKSSQTFRNDFLTGLEKIRQILPLKIKSSILIYAGENESKIKEHTIINYESVPGLKL